MPESCYQMPKKKKMYIIGYTFLSGFAVIRDAIKETRGQIQLFLLRLGLYFRQFQDPILIEIVDLVCDGACCW